MTDKRLNPKGEEYNTPKEISIPVWFNTGSGMNVRRDCLDISNPNHTYNYCKNVLNIRPEDYGIKHPYALEFGEKSREELIDEILQLRQECIEWQQCG